MVYTYNEIIEGLKRVEIKKGDSLFIHSNLGYFGRLDGCKSAEELCYNFLTAIKEVIGEDGTIVVPAFTYSFCHNEIFDPKATPTKCGIFPEYIRKLKGSIRSKDPNFSIVAYGKNKELYTVCPPNESFGKNSFWERFIYFNGKIVCMNFDCGSTFVHYVEKQNNVSYRYNKAFNGVIKEDNEQKKDYFVHYVYDLEKPKDAPCFTKLDILCKRNGVCRSTHLGKGNINLLVAKEYFKFISYYLEIEPRFLTIGGNE